MMICCLIRRPLCSLVYFLGKDCALKDWTNPTRIFLLLIRHKYGAAWIFPYHHFPWPGFEPMSAKFHRPRTFWRTLNRLSYNATTKNIQKWWCPWKLTIESAEVLHGDLAVAPDGRHGDENLLAAKTLEAGPEVLPLHDEAHHAFVHVEHDCNSAKRNRGWSL